jgi:hypothetical protein
MHRKFKQSATDTKKSVYVQEKIHKTVLTKRALKDIVFARSPLSTVPGMIRRLNGVGAVQ